MKTAQSKKLTTAAAALALTVTIMAAIALLGVLAITSVRAQDTTPATVKTRLGDLKFGTWKLPDVELVK